jgi:autotransporter-associated beta strand protein
MKYLKIPSNPRSYLPSAFYLAVAAAATWCSSPSAFAANNTWDGGASPDGSWTNANNWVGDTNVPGAVGGTTNTDTATFNNSANTSISIDSGRNLGGFVFGSGAGAFTFAGSALGLNAHNGGIVMNAGVTNSQTFNNELLGVVGTATRIYNFTNNSSTLGAELIINGNVTGRMTTAGNTFLLNGSNNGTINGVISNGVGGGFVSVTKQGSGTWTLAGANTYTGNTTVNGGTLKLGANNTIPLASSLTVNETSANSTATLDLNGFNQTVTALNFGGLSTSITSTPTSSSRVIGVGSTLTTNGVNYTTNVNNQQLGATLSTSRVDLNGAVRTFAIADSANADIELTVSSTIQNGGISKNGAGVLALTGANIYAGATNVSAGTLLVNGTHTVSTGAASATAYNITSNVSGTGALGGNGVINLSAINSGVTIGTGAKLAPGASVGSLTFNLGTGVLNTSAAVGGANVGAFVFELGSAATPGLTYDQVILTTGVLNIGSLVLEDIDFNFVELAGFGNGVYTLFDTNSVITGSFGADVTVNFSGGRTGTLSFANGNTDIILTVVPEPSAVALVGLGLTFVLWRRRGGLSL